MQQYLIIYENKVWYTDWYDGLNTFRIGMIVIDLYKKKSTNDGTNWTKISEDHL